MSKLKRMGVNVRQLRQVYEIRHADELDDDDEPEMITQRHPTRSLTNHMLFTLAVRITNIEKKKIIFLRTNYTNIF